MLETLHFEEGVPILRQLPKPFTSAAFLLHPFVRMPDGGKSKSANGLMDICIRVMRRSSRWADPFPGKPS
ncbi:DUF2711 family protein [Bacillus velezensis]